MKNTLKEEPKQGKLNYKELSKRFTEKLESTTNCPTCGTEVYVEGDTSKYHYPKFTQEMFDEKDKEIAELSELLQKAYHNLTILEVLKEEMKLEIAELKRQLKSLQMKLFINNEM